MASSNKTGLVLKISMVLIVLLALLVYKLNDYFRNDKSSLMQSQIRSRVVSIKTSVSSQLAQLKNTLSGYQSELSDSKINWVQLDPFFLIAKADNADGVLKVSQIVARSNTPAERWNSAYLEQALRINKSNESSAILVQLFQDQAKTKFILIRFAMDSGKELIVASTAEYFQKYFDIERGSRNTSLLVTTENILAGHTEGDYIATPSTEAGLSPKKYIIEKEEIVGTNLSAVSYVLKKKMESGFAVPWSIVGVVIGFGFILIGVLFYGLDPIERRVERYRKQERDQIYKETLDETTQNLKKPNLIAPKKNVNLDNPNLISENESNTNLNARSETQSSVLFPELTLEDMSEVTKTKTITVNNGKLPPPISETENNKKTNADRASTSNLYDLLEDIKPVTENKKEVNLSVENNNLQEKIQNFAKVLNNEEENKTAPLKADDQFITLDEEKIDLEEIEKALALDEFDDDRATGLPVNPEVLEMNLKPQKISVSPMGAPIEKPQFSLQKKEFQVDAIKVNIRRPERS